MLKEEKNHKEKTVKVIPDSRYCIGLFFFYSNLILFMYIDVFACTHVLVLQRIVLGIEPGSSGKADSTLLTTETFLQSCIMLF